MKEHGDILAHHLTELFNVMVRNGQFPDELKEGDASSLFKKNVLPTRSIIGLMQYYLQYQKFLRLMNNHIIQFSEYFLSPLLCISRSDYSTQHDLLRFIEKCKESLDKNGFAGAVLMDLSKAIDSLNHKTRFVWSQ